MPRASPAFIDGASDVDWYQFDVGYEKISRDSAALHLSTIFDIDYADGVARADTAIYVFNELRELVLIGTDSNIADDQPPGQTDISDLSRGSFGTGDPFIGSAELSEGTYFVAVANQDRVPVQLSQYFDVDSSNPLLRLEPIDSVTRIAEDRIYRPSAAGLIDDTGNYDVNGDLVSLGGGNFVDENGFLRDRATGELLLVNGEPRVAGGGTASAADVPVLFDENSILEYSLDDVLLYVNTGTTLAVVNPFTGEQYLPGSSLGTFGGEFISDVAFRANGELFGYTANAPIPADDATEYVRINTSDASLTTIGNLGIQTFHLVDFDPMNLILDTPSDDGIQVEAITIREFLGAEEGFLVGNRPLIANPVQGQPPLPRAGLQYSTNILYEFNDATGALIGPTYDRSRFAPGAGTTPREIGQINTTPPIVPDPNVLQTQLGITNATEIGPNGIAVPSIVDGDFFTLSNVTETVSFEFDQGFTLLASGNQPVRDGDAIVIDGVVFEFNTGARLQLSDVAPLGLLSEGTTVTVQGVDATATFEFVRFGQPRPGNQPILLVDNQGIARSLNQITADLAAGINTNVTGLAAQSRAGKFSSPPHRPH